MPWLFTHTDSELFSLTLGLAWFPHFRGGEVPLLEGPSVLGLCPL